MCADREIGLTLVFGPANSGKLGLVLDWWRERLGEHAVVVTPTGPDARELTAEMVGREGGLVQQAPALTFDGLVQLLVGRSLRYATELERFLMVSRVLAETPTRALQTAARLPGVVSALGALLQQLGESGRPSEEIDSILARWAAADLAEEAIAEDVRRLARAYDETCSRLGRCDRSATVREATEAVSAGGGRGGGPGWCRPVALYGFTSFTPGQRSLIEALARRTEVLVAFTYDGAREVNLSTPAEIAWWRSRASAETWVTSSGRAYESAAVEYLERYFMSDEQRSEPPESRPGEGVRFMKAAGRRAEAESAAEQIAELMRAGVEGREIAVVVRSVSTWSRLLPRVFDSCSIPYSLDHRPSLRQTGLGHAFISAVRGVFCDDARAVLAYLRSPYSGLSLDRVSDLEVRYRRGASKGARVLAEGAAAAGLQTVGSLWGMSASDGLLDPVAARGVVLGMLVAASAGVLPTSLDLEEDARAFRALDGALQALSELAGAGATVGGAHTLVDYRTVLAGLGSVRVAPPRDDAAAVHVLSVQRARARRFPVVFVLGLVEGEFPARAERPSLLTPAQRSRLDRLGGGLFAEEADDEAALFVSALSRASRLLYLSARDAEDDGSEATPSHFWTWARDLLEAGESELLCRTLGDQAFSLRTAPTVRHYERACAVAGLGIDRAGAGPVRSIPSWECARAALSDPDVLAELSATQRFSPSGLESYAKCPFVWFVQKTVGAEELEVELDGRQIGQLLHSALRSIYQELESLGLLPLRGDGVSAARRVAEGVIETLVGGAECPGSVAERRLAGWQLGRMTGNLFDMEIAADWSLVPHEYEVWVGGRHGVDLGGFRVHGRVDRVDASGDRRGLFVIDYKSGNIPSASAIGSEGGLQLPLYLMAMAAERPKSALLGGAYLALSDKKRSGIAVEGSEQFLGEAIRGCRVLDQTAMDELLQKTLDISRSAVEGIRNGVIAPRDDRSCPPWCELGPACRARRGGYRP